MLNSARPCASLVMGEGFSSALHNHYFDTTEKLSPKGQQVFAEAIAHAMLGGLIVRHTLKQTSSIEEGSEQLFDVLLECISIHGKNILSLAPPLLTKDGSAITAIDIVASSGSTLTQKPVYPALEQFGIFKSTPVTTWQESGSPQLTCISLQK